MKKTLNPFCRKAKFYVSIFAAWCIFATSAMAQSNSCQPATVSLNGGGTGIVDSAVVGAQSSDPMVTVTSVTIMVNGVNTGSNQVDCDDIGQDVMAVVRYSQGAQCMSVITVQDKWNPSINCKSVLIGCDEGHLDAPTPPVSDACTPTADIDLDGVVLPPTTANLTINGFDGAFTSGNLVYDVDANVGEEGVLSGLLGGLRLVGANSGLVDANSCLVGLDDPGCYTAKGCFTMPVGGAFTFNWTNEQAEGSTGHDPEGDPTGYSITDADGMTTYVPLSNTGTTSGTQNVTLEQGDQICFLVGSNGNGVFSHAVFNGFSYTMDAPGDCGPDYIIKRWTATDQYDNSSACTQIIQKDVIPFEEIEFPNDITVSCETSFPMDADGNPTLAFIGEPEGCNIQVAPPVFTLLTQPECGTGASGCYTFKADWHVWDECTQRDTSHTQLIKIMDTNLPTIAPLEDVTISTDIWSCTTTYILPEPSITDACSAIGDYDVNSIGGDLSYNAALGRYVLSNLEIGTYTVNYEVSDCCGNEAMASFDVTVQDLVPPNPVCETEHTTSLTIDGTAKVFAETFDDNSHDNCGDVWFKVIRMDDLNGTLHGSDANQMTTVANGMNGDDSDTKFGNQIYFDDEVFFDCEDIGNEDLMVVFRVFDVDPGDGPVNPADMKAGGIFDGRYNDCMVSITVEDKLAPLISCPASVTISCEYWYDMNNLPAAFGDVVDDIANRESYEINDSGAGTTTTILDGVAYDNCSVTVEEATPAVNLSCGVGTITRFWTATDAFGKTATCSQTITVVDYNPFTGSDITWPSNQNLSGCPNGTEPESTGTPTIVNDDVCALISTTYEDENYPIAGGGCFAILRKWKVTDICNFDPNDTDLNNVIDMEDTGVVEGQWTYNQLITVFTSDAPTFDDCTDKEYCGLNNDCTGDVILTQNVSDDCTDDSELIVDFKIDLDNDGTFDLVGANVSPYPYPNPMGLPIVPATYTEDAVSGWNVNVASRTYDVGTHRVLWSATDRCGEVGTCEYLFTVNDCKLPTPKAQSGITEIMPSTTSITVPASWFDNGSFDNCGVEQILIYSPTLGTDQDEPPVGAATTWTFTCDDVDADQTVDFWVEDINGNWDYVTTTVDIQANNGACGNAINALIAGSVESELGENIVEVMVDAGVSTMQYTGNDGEYEFADMQLNQDYTVAPIKNDDIRNGLTTLDLVLLSRHLIGLQTIDSPYKLLAADVNGDETISAFDLLDLQKLMLYIYDEFPNDVPSWRFIDASFTFANESDPFSSSFPEEYYINDLNEDMMAVDFIGVKIGDINNSAQLSPDAPAQPRSFAGDFPMIVEETTEGLQIVAGTDAVVSGLQMAINVAGIQDVRAGLFNVSSANVRQLESNVYNMVFASGTDINVTEGDVLFTIVSDIATEVTISAKGLESEVYSADLELLIPNFGKNDAINADRLFQNTPNPFKQETTINFTLTESSAATLQVYDVSGKVLKSITGNYSSGMNKIVLSAADLPATGVLYYQLSTDKFNATRKMIIAN